VGASKNKGFKTHFKSNPTPCKKKKIQHIRDTHNPYPRFERVNNKKWGNKSENFEGNGLLQQMGKIWRNNKKKE
jgi:hypothetical protein